MIKKRLVKKYLARNNNELDYLQRKIEKKFNKSYKIIGNGRMITELGIKKNVNMYPQDSVSNIEKVVLRKDKSKDVWAPIDRTSVMMFQIHGTEYYISNNPNHFSR